MNDLEKRIAELETLVQSQQIRLKLIDFTTLFLSVSLIIHMLSH